MTSTRSAASADDQRPDVDLLDSEEEELGVGEDPLDVAARRNGQREDPAALRRAAHRRGRLGEGDERCDRAPQLVRDDPEVGGRDGAWLQLRPSSFGTCWAGSRSVRSAAERSTGSGSSRYGAASR